MNVRSQSRTLQRKCHKFSRAIRNRVGRRHVFVCECIVYVCAFKDVLQKISASFGYLHAVHFSFFFHFCTHFVPNISMPDPKCLRMTVPPCVFVCVCRPSREGLQDYSCLLPVGSSVAFLSICCSHGPEFLQRGILGGHTRDFLYITAVADCDKLPAVYQQVAQDLRDARSTEHRG